MNITKLEHACLDITVHNSRLIVDPGNWTSPLDDYENITAVVITHVHADHFDPEKVSAIIAANPAVQLFTTDQVANEITNHAVTTVNVGKQYTAGDITLEFFGGQHAQIMAGYP